MDEQTILHIEDRNPQESYTVSAEVLTRLIDGFQELVWLLAAKENDYDFRQRFKLSESIKQQYILCCGVPSPGSYIIPLAVKNFSRPLADDGNNIEKILIAILVAISMGDFSNPAIVSIPEAYKARVSHIIETMSPKKDDTWTASLYSGKDQKVIFTHEFSKKAQAMYVRKEDKSVETMSVIGEFIAVQFEERKLTIRHPVYHTEITCIYLPETECELLEKRRDFIQVTGQFTLNSNGIPEKLSDVSKIVPVDLSPINMEKFSFGDTTVRLKNEQSLNLVPSLDEEYKQLYVIQDDSISLYVYAQTRDSLIDELNEQIVMLWKEYALADTSSLTSSAMDLKNAMLSKFEEAPNAER